MLFFHILKFLNGLNLYSVFRWFFKVVRWLKSSGLVSLAKLIVWVYDWCLCSYSWCPSEGSSWPKDLLPSVPSSVALIFPAFQSPVLTSLRYSFTKGIERYFHPAFSWAFLLNSCSECVIDVPVFLEQHLGSNLAKLGSGNIFSIYLLIKGDQSWHYLL